jgi:hypothetical protein
VKLKAFDEIQDFFDCPIYPDATFVNIFQIWYFYYEARALLAEVIVAGFNGLYSASTAVLRLFLEFSLLQLYFYRICESQNSYQSLETYFKTGRKPAWNTMLNKALPDDSFCRPIKFLLDLHLKGLSISAAHPYHPDFSPRHHSCKHFDRRDLFLVYHSICATNGVMGLLCEFSNTFSSSRYAREIWL